MATYLQSKRAFAMYHGKLMPNRCTGFGPVDCKVKRVKIVCMQPTKGRHSSKYRHHNIQMILTAVS